MFGFRIILDFEWLDLDPHCTFLFGVGVEKSELQCVSKIQTSLDLLGLCQNKRTLAYEEPGSSGKPEFSQTHLTISKIAPKSSTI